MTTIARFLAIATGIVFANGAVAQDLACDPQSVELVGAEILISPGSDDRANIQCGLEEAVSRGVQKVKLDRGTFTLSDTVSVIGYQGQLEGTTRSDTVVEFDGAFGFVFAVGAPSVKFMTMVDTSADDSIAIGFFTNPGNCAQRTIFGEVDRVDFISTDSGLNSTAVLATREGSCASNQTLLGKLTVNRISTTGFPTGVLTQMGGSASISITNNEFSDADFCLFLDESNTDTSFLGNRCEFSVNAVVAGNINGTFPANRLRLQDNILTSANPLSGTVIACLQVLSSSATAMTLNVLNNSCTINGGDAAVTVLTDQVDSAVITGNTFSGATDGIFLFDSDDTYINGNVFSNIAATADIGIDVDSSGTIIGPQSAVIDDQGTGTILLQ